MVGAAPDAGTFSPLILGIGGTTREGSSSERSLREALGFAQRLGARVEVLTAEHLELPTYAPERGPVGSSAGYVVEKIRRSDGLIVASPGFHGGPSGLIKNAIDHVEELRTSDPPYLDGRAVGCIVCAAGWQATTTTLVSLRSTIHSLRGWPTPLGVTINSAGAHDGDPVQAASPQLEMVAEQVVQFARWRHAWMADAARS